MIVVRKLESWASPHLATSHVSVKIQYGDVPIGQIPAEILRFIFFFLDPGDRNKYWQLGTLRTKEGKRYAE